MPRTMARLLWVVVVLVVAIGAAAIFWLRSPLPPPRVTGQTLITHDRLTKTNLFSDGAVLYFTEMRGGRFVISKVAARGGEISAFPTSFPSSEVLGVSPDRSSLLVAPDQVGTITEYAFWTFPLAGGAPHRLGDINGHEAAWSPDGQHILFVKHSSLLVANSDGTQSRELLNVKGTLYSPRYSPDGQRIRFSIGDPTQNTSSIWEVRGDGSGLHPLLPGWHDPAADCCGNWTADGRYYIFQVAQGGPTGTTSLWALAEPDPAGCFHRKRPSSPVQLTAGTVSYGNTTPSPDNKKLWTIGLELRGSVVRYDSGSNRYVPFLGGISASDLDFSSDGQWVAYVTVPQGTLWRSRIDGTERLRLTSPLARAALPRWSPDGKQIAYVVVEPGKPWKIFLVPVEGGKPRALLSENLPEIDMNWSPDGNKMIFGRVSQYNPEGLSIKVYDLKSHELSTIPESDGLFSPRLSPDGRYIAAFSPALSKLMLFDTRTRKWSDWLSEPSGAVNYAVWAADSKYLYFEDLVSGEASYRRLKVGETQPEGLLVIKGIERYLGPFGLWSGRAPDGSPLFVRDASIQEVYALDVNPP